MNELMTLDILSLSLLDKLEPRIGLKIKKLDIINFLNNRTYISFITGKTTISFPLYGVEWEKMVANSKFKDWEGFGKFKTGYIGLQDHSDQVSFKKIKIKEI